MTIQSWPHQIKADAMLRDNYLAGYRAPAMIAATGSGKTYIGCKFIQGASKKGKKIIFLNHRVELIRQTSRKLDEFGLPHGIISPQYKQTTDSIQVASVQTLVRRLDRLPWTPDILVVDECHMSAAPTFKKVFAKFPKAYLLGLTATFQRLDRKGLGIHCGGHFDSIVEPTNMQELIDGGYLVKPVVYAPSTPDLHGVRTMMGDYDHAQTEKLMDKKELVGDVVSHWLKLAKGRPTMAFCVSIAHAEHVAEQFRAAGVRAKSVSGNTPTDERFDAINALGDGRLEVVANCSLWIEGVDQPAVSCIVLLSPTKSLTRYLQSVGRGMRKYPGKQTVVILDHSGCCFEHGLPQEPRVWSLDGAAKAKKKTDDEAVQRCKMCQSCYGMNPVWRNACEQCGAPFEAHRELPKHVDGELVEITEADKLAMKFNAKREVGEARTREQLVAIAKARGYKPQWVDYILNARSKNVYDGPVRTEGTIREWKGEAA